MLRVRKGHTNTNQCDIAYVTDFNYPCSTPGKSGCVAGRAGVGVVVVQALAKDRRLPRPGEMVSEVSLETGDGGLILKNSRVLGAIDMGEVILTKLAPAGVQHLNANGHPVAELLEGTIAGSGEPLSLNMAAAAAGPRTHNFWCHIFPTGDCCTLTNHRCCR